MSGDTERLEKKPWLKVCLDYALNRLGLIIITAIFSAITSCNHWEHKETAKELWQHIADKQQQINELRESK